MSATYDSCDLLGRILGQWAEAAPRAKVRRALAQTPGKAATLALAAMAREEVLCDLQQGLSMWGAQLEYLMRLLHQPLAKAYSDLLGACLTAEDPASAEIFGAAAYACSSWLEVSAALAQEADQ